MLCYSNLVIHNAVNLLYNYDPDFPRYMFIFHKYQSLPIIHHNNNHCMVTTTNIDDKRLTNCTFGTIELLLLIYLIFA